MDAPRICSARFEKHTVEFLNRRYPNRIVVPNSAVGLADLFVDNDFRFPINLKFVSEKNPKALFNLVSPTNSLHHMFFDHIPIRMSDEQLSKNIFHRNFSNTINDIGFVIVTKETGQVQYMTMLSARSIAVNTRNGFQTSLSNVDIDLETTPHDARELLIEKYTRYLEKRARPYNRWFSYHHNKQLLFDCSE